ncbi:DEAD/DEAH box helicase [archaeon]|jgi:ERCC4-related helicase|nr:DEAD/DEAH box helicase [archaeon]
MEFLENITPRKYQEEIYKTCTEKNCLVVLPTGLGKTLIALMLTIDRMKKYPREKILILAPTKPLAEQHLKSFKKNLPELFGDIQLFTGTVKAKNRKKIWETADIVFSTPQCIANDLKNKLYNLEDVSLLVEDEAHRCVKNYDYTFISQAYLLQAKHPRLVGLTASPGSDPRQIKEICKNLSIEEVELRTRNSPDVKEYLQELEFEKVEVDFPEELKKIKLKLAKIYDNYIDKLRMSNFLFGPDNKFALIELQKKLASQIARNYGSPQAYHAVSSTAQAIKIAHAMDLLETQTLGSFHKYMKGLYTQAEKKQSKGVVRLVANPEFNQAFAYTHEILTNGKEHPKVEKIVEIISREKNLNKNLKIIIFTQFRDSASLISKRINKIENIKSKVFVGQAKKEGVGLSQKEQKQMIEEFSDGTINILVATCIAEEGLDIPEVNAVIFYEPVSSAIRSIQRRGRTARLQKGKLIMMITKGTRDEFAYYASRSREKKMETSIAKIKDELKRKGKFTHKDFIQKKLS